ncbi:hypothetical protein WR25_17960 [Diploscapter pachys]|uniref:ZP domain-containing protein n=1 Tax=Diploscapter pachys TaxID=2018661 RepID=A0A2A2LN33_9BILA|nr:hypothetical protein WR25_17960 [Diploscapter pachys]
MVFPFHSILGISLAKWWLLGSITIATVVHGSSPPALDNGIMDTPIVECLEDKIRLRMNTQRPFHGRIFVKGMSAKAGCSHNYINNSGTKIIYELDNGACNMRRRRMANDAQRGVETSLTIIVSFHSTFITQVDKAFRTTCFYMEGDRVVTNRIDVSNLPTTDLLDSAKMPQCTYSVRKDSPNGPLVQFAKVGEPVFHVWTCDSEVADIFQMLVHSCFVDDGNGEERRSLLDENGCAIDPLIMPDLTYNKQNNMAYALLNVFKYADKVTTYFQCAVSTCLSSEILCEGRTPPHCGPGGSLQELASSPRTNRVARELQKNGQQHNRSTDNDHFMMNTMDLATQKITILDLDDPKNNDAKEGVLIFFNFQK